MFRSAEKNIWLNQWAEREIFGLVHQWNGLDSWDRWRWCRWASQMIYQWFGAAHSDISYPEFQVDKFFKDHHIKLSPKYASFSRSTSTASAYNFPNSALAVNGNVMERCIFVLRVYPHYTGDVLKNYYYCMICWYEAINLSLFSPHSMFIGGIEWCCTLIHAEKSENSLICMRKKIASVQLMCVTMAWWISVSLNM